MLPIMVRKVFPIVLILLGGVVLTRSQALLVGKCRAKTNIEDDILMQVQELETEFSYLQNSSLETERLLQDDEKELRNRLTQLEAEFVSYQNETLDKQRELENEILKKQTDLERELNETNSRLTKVEMELD